MIKNISKEIDEIREEIDMYLFYVKDIHNKPKLYDETEILQVEQLAKEVESIAKVMRENKGS